MNFATGIRKIEGFRWFDRSMWFFVLCRRKFTGVRALIPQHVFLWFVAGRLPKFAGSRGVHSPTPGRNVATFLRLQWTLPQVFAWFGRSMWVFSALSMEDHLRYSWVWRDRYHTSDRNIATFILYNEGCHRSQDRMISLMWHETPLHVFFALWQMNCILRGFEGTGTPHTTEMPLQNMCVFFVQWSLSEIFVGT